MTQYPRVLLITIVKVKKEDAGSLLIRTQFADWPKDHLAQIHASADPVGYGEFCGSYYRLQNCDRRFGGLFARLRGSVFNMVAVDKVAKARPVADKPWVALFGILKKRVGDILIASGLWEIVFAVRFSESIKQFVQDFKPDIIYCQGYSLGFVNLPLLIARHFNLPICFQTTDDWPRAAYKYSPVSFLLKREAEKLIRQARLRLAFGEKMQLEYQKRYGVPFEVTYHLDDPARFPPGQPPIDGLFRIVYTGSLALRRYEALSDLLSAVRQSSELKTRTEIIVYSPGMPKDMPEDLLRAPEFRFFSLPTHDKLPSVLSSASMLFLPESFNVTRGDIEFSISTKAHLYMMSARPVLVYGPVYSGTVEYALREGWGVAIPRRDTEELKKTLEEIFFATSRVEHLKQKADHCIKRNHNILTGQEKFFKALQGCLARR